MCVDVDAGSGPPGSTRRRRARRRTAAAAADLRSRGEVALEEDPLAQPRLGDLERLEAPGVQCPPHDHRAGQDQVGARRLDPGHAAALRGRQRRQPPHQLLQGLQRDDHPLHAVGRHPRGALRGGGEVAHRPADPDQPSAGRGQPGRGAQFAGDVLAQLLQLPALRRGGARQEALGHPHRPEPPRARLASLAIDDPHELHRPAAEVEHAPVGERCGVDRREVAVARLGLAAEHADRQIRAAPARAPGRPRRSRRRGSRSWPPRRRHRPLASPPRRSGRTRRASPARARSAPPRDCPKRPGLRRCGPADRSRRCAATIPRRR